MIEGHGPDAGRAPSVAMGLESISCGGSLTLVIIEGRQFLPPGGQNEKAQEDAQ